MKNTQNTLEEYEIKLFALQKEEKESVNEFKAILFFPDDYWYEYALTQMLKFVENKEADNWKEVTSLYREHVHRMRMEENARQRLEEAMRQTEIAKQTRNAAGLSAAGAWASAIGIWSRR